MDTTEYKPNSHKYKEQLAKEANEEKKEIQKVIKGTAIKKSEPVTRKLADTFLAEDRKNVKSYILFDVVIPAIKDTIVDLITNGTNMLFYGSTASRHSSSSRGSTSKIDYAGYSKGKTARPAMSSRESRRSYDDIIFERRGDAQEVKDCLEDILERYKIVTIADYYELAGVNFNYTDRDFGWFSLDGVYITRDIDGYKLKLPKPVPID